MAEWHIEERMLTLQGGVRVPHLLFISDNSEEVRIAAGRDWFLEYRCADLKAAFNIFRDPPSSDENDLRLGPNCMVQMRRGRLSRPLERKDFEVLAMSVKETLRMHLQIPGAVPPRIERVRFLDREFQPFDD